MTDRAVLWFRRDLRLGDHPALAAAANEGSDECAVLAVFVVDPALTAHSGGARVEALRRALRSLDASLDGRLCVLEGDPVEQIPRVADAIGAGSVHVSSDHGPYGSLRDRRVEEAVGDLGIGFHRTGSPYAVTPGRIRTGAGEPYKVFSAFRRSWYEHGWRGPADTGADSAEWIDPQEVDGRLTVDDALPGDAPDGVALPEVGESAALAAWRSFLDERLPTYATDRDRPDLDRTSRMSVHLKYGTVHPRTLLADLAALGATDSLTDETADGRDAFASELAWRDFYADVLHHRPHSARRNVDDRWDSFPWDSGSGAREAFDAWREGRTGYPIVDAGMRQLLGEGWMHNRVRMITASFLTKDLHVDWRPGARHFLDHLVDGDLASNQHGWQWTAGTGTDAAPFFRVFNPVTQGERFDPDGDYVRRWVPELAGVEGRSVHRPRADGLNCYPAPIVDHAEERREALARYESTVKGR